MKTFFLLLLFPLYIWGAYTPTILSLENEYPVQINTQNKKKTKEQQDIETIVNSKKFPWEYVLEIICLGLLFLIARQQSQNPEDYDEMQKRHRKIAQQRALESLNGLSSLDLSEEQKIDQLTFIVRRYIEEYYSLSATTETTEEFLRNMTENPIFDQQTQLALANFLQSADIVKFSDHTPTPEESALALKTARNFIYL